MPIFHATPGLEARIAVTVNGVRVSVPAGASAAAAVLLSGPESTRISPVDESPRAPFCMMGVCFECLMTIDGTPNRQACMVNVAPGMTIECARPQKGNL